jgi:hypothetical protein
MSKRQKPPEGGQDTEIILLCAKYIACWHQQRVIAIADEWAPDKGPLHLRYAELGAKEREIAHKLYQLGRPRTKGGIAAMAELALTSWPRTLNGLACTDITRWMAMAVVQGVAEADEPVDPGEALRYFAGTEVST